MKKTVGQELLTMLRSQHDGCSLYSLHNILCISDANVYQIAKGERHMATDTILISCDILGVDPQPWLLQSEIETCRSLKRKELLKRMLEKLESAPARVAAAFLTLFAFGVFDTFPGVYI